MNYELWQDRFDSRFNDREYRSVCENSDCTFSVRWFADDPQEPSHIECPICGGVIVA